VNISDFFKPYIDRLKDTLSGKSNGKEKYADSIVINNGKILLLRRSILDSNPSQWSLPGGHVDSGEDFNEAAKRELREETNLDADECTLVFVKDKPEVEVHYFLCNVSNQDLMMLDNNEHYNYKWCNYQEWNDLDLVFDLKDTLNNLFPNLVEEDKEKIRLESELVKAHCRISKLFDEGKLNEDIIFKSTYLCKKADVLEQAMLSYSEIKKGGKWAQFGEVRQWGGFKYQKQQDGNWSKVANASTNPENGGELNEKENNKGNKDNTKQEESSDLSTKLESQTFSYEPSSYLSDPKYKAIEEKFGSYLKNNFKEAYNRYTEEYKNEVNTDNVRELSEDYRENRGELSAAVHEPSSAFTKKMYEVMLSKPIVYGQVFFTGGGTGAGKSSGIQNVSRIRSVSDKSDVVYDTNMNKFGSSVKKIDQALNSGRKVVVTYVVRDPVDSFVNGMIPRMIKRGRSVPISAHVESYIGAIQTAKDLKGHYKNNDSVEMRLINNTLGRGNAREENFEFLDKVSTFNKESLTNELTQITEKLYSDGKITESQYRGIIGSQKTDTSTNKGTPPRGGGGLHKGFDSKRGGRPIHGGFHREPQPQFNPIGVLSKSFEIIKKGFDDGIVSEEMYFDALEKVQPYLEIAKARKNYQVGEISQSTGLKKVAPGKWIDPKTGKKANPDDQKGEKGDKKEETQKDASQYSDKELENHAKETDTESLRQAAEGSNEKLRVEAKKELARREKEEIAQEGKGSKEIEESPKKDVKIDPSFVELNKKHELSRLPVNIPKDDVEVNDGSKKGNWILKWVDPKTGKTVTAYSKEFLKKNAQDKWKRIQSVSKEDVEGIRDKSKGLMSSDDSGVAQSAAIINIIANSGLRPGSKSGFKETENRGVSTLAVENVKVDGDSVSFEFVGKSYKTNTATIESPELAEYLTRQMKGKSGSDVLFDIDISNVRDVFKKDVSQSEDMKLKDMRTYVATDMARKILFEDDSLPPPLPEKGAKKAIQDKLKKVFKMVSDQLNNTPNMAKTSYIHPNIINSWLTTLGTSDADMYMIKSLSVDIFKSSDSEVKGDDDEEVEEGDDQYLLPDWWDEAITPMGGDNTSTLDEIKQLL